MSLFLRYEDMWDRALGGTTDEKQIPHWFANFAYVLIGFVFKVLFRYRVDGRENLRAFKDCCGAVVVSNHTSFLDVVLMYVAARPGQFVRLMGRDSLFGNAHGLAGQILSRVGAFPIKRDSADRTAIKRAAHMLKGNQLVGILPEGTRRGKGSKTPEIHSGAAFIAKMGKAPILPMCVREAENVKRVRAVQLHPSANGLTIIGGNNNQGKTSLLDTIAWALGGDRFRPSMATREGSTIPPHIKVTLSNGLIVERRGKNSDLKVIDPSGSKAGQQLLNAFIEQLALDLPRFMQASDREKADTLLRIIGVGEQLAALERKEQEQYNERLAIGRIADQKAKYAKEQPYWPDAPDELISASDLIRQQQAILARNGENQSKRAMASLLEQQVSTLTARVDELHRQLQTAEDELTAKTADLVTARKTAEQLVDESTEELERSIADIETINAKVRDNLNREKAEEDARAYQQQYDSLTAEIEQLREDKRALLDGAKLPMEGLGVADGALTYHGQKWDNMSGSEQLRVATAIVRCLKPQCGFVLLDKLEQMDLGTLREFGAWLESEGLQAIATRVSTGDECSIIIEDGYVQGEEQPLPDEPQSTWKAGAF